MDINKKLYIIEQLTKRIDQQNTGNARQLASDLGISRSQLYIEFNDLSNLGIEIGYDKTIGSYNYRNTKRIAVQNPLRVFDIKDEEV